MNVFFSFTISLKSDNIFEEQNSCGGGNRSVLYPGKDWQNESYFLVHIASKWKPPQRPPMQWRRLQQKPLLPTPVSSPPQTKFCSSHLFLGFGIQVPRPGFLKNREVVCIGKSSFFPSSWPKRFSNCNFHASSLVSQLHCKKIKPVVKVVILIHHGLDQKTNIQFWKGYTDWYILTITGNVSFYFLPLFLLYDVVLRHTH